MPRTRETARDRLEAIPRDRPMASMPAHMPDLRFQRATDRVEVFLVEDHGYFRQGMSELLAAHDSGVAIVGDAGSAEEALRQIPKLQPDVVLMDIHLPGKSGIEAIRQLSLICPLVHVLILSGSGEDGDVVEAILAGARGYLLKSSPVPEIAAGVRAAAAGGSVLSPMVASYLLDHVRKTSPDSGATASPLPALTPRELEVLRLMAAGCENSKIAEELTISTRTARNHVASILEKLHMENRIQAAVYAVKHGLA
jgi:DNA-binding NarL/FixJ family response regulator